MVPPAEATAYRLPRECAGYIRARLTRSTPGKPARANYFAASMAARSATLDVGRGRTKFNLAGGGDHLHAPATRRARKQLNSLGSGHPIRFCEYLRATPPGPIEDRNEYP